MTGSKDKMRRTWLAVVTAVSLTLVPVQAAAMRSACPAPPSAVRDLDVPGYYRDARKSVVEPRALAARRAAVAPLHAFLDTVTRFADGAASGSDRRRSINASCALNWLGQWAEAGAYLGDMANKQAEAQRRWDLAGLALAYLKVRRSASPGERRSIEPWLRDIADRDRALFDDPGRQRNNHWYWLGLGHGGVGAAVQSARHWAVARRVMEDAADHVAGDGVLSLEIKRGQRALHYHAFAAQALVLLAEIAAAKGEDWYRLGDGALHRLVNVTATGLADPALFARHAGIVQERPVNPRAGWLQLYDLRFPGRLPPDLTFGSRRGRRIGGDALVLRAVLGKLERTR
ncbi:MAG: alginate lyase family protein [Hyphomicrobiaceae bacterium]